MRVLLLTQWYKPEPTPLQHELAQSLIARGHEVTVLTGFPNYPSGKLYPGYKVRPLQHEVMDGVPIVRVPLYPEHSRSAAGRVVNYGSFAASAALLGLRAMPRPDVLFVYHPPLTVGWPAYVLSRFWRAPFVYQIQDMWPETLSATGMLNNPTMLAGVGNFARWVYDKAAAILVISPGFRRNLLEKGVPDAKIHVISNWVDPQAAYVAEPDPALAARLGLADCFNIMFAGNMGEAQGLDTVIAAAELLRDLPQVQFVFVGDGVAQPGLQAAASAKGLTNVRFLGRYPGNQMPGLYALADVLLIHLKDDPLFRITIPSKTFTYLASGKPILAAVAGDTEEVIRNAGAGLTCEPGDPQGLAHAVRVLYAMDSQQRSELGQHGRSAALTTYSREQLTQEIERVLRSVVRRT